MRAVEMLFASKSAKGARRLAAPSWQAPARSRPTMPLSLSDDEYAAVQAAAAPIHPLQRGAFVKALAAELERHPVVGPGVVHRCAAALQKTFVVAGAQRDLALRRAATPRLLSASKPSQVVLRR
jgi:hypothetical protein